MVSCKKCLSICPNVFGLNCLIGMSKSAADRDTAPIVAIAKMVAELTSRQDGMIRQQLIEQLMPEITNYDAEFRREDATGAIGSHVRH